MRLLILASTSPYRRQLLSRLQLPFTCAPPPVAEDEILGELPEARALRLAEAKARVLAGVYPQALIIGGDQTISSAGVIFDKPGNKENAIAQLRAMRGRDLHFFTAVAVLDARDDKLQSALVSHRAHFRAATDDEILRYVDKESAFNCAGGAQIEGLGVSLLARLEGGDPTAIVGLPLIATAAMLRAAGLSIP